MLLILYHVFKVFKPINHKEIGFFSSEKPVNSILELKCRILVSWQLLEELHKVHSMLVYGRLGLSIVFHGNLWSGNILARHNYLR